MSTLPGTTAWTDSEVALLRELAAAGLGSVRISQRFPDRSPDAVRSKAAKMRLSLRERDGSGHAIYTAGQLLGQPKGESWSDDPDHADHRERVMRGDLDESLAEQMVANATTNMKRRRICPLCGERPVMTRTARLCVMCSEDERQAAYDAADTSGKDQQRRVLRNAARYHEARARELRDALERLEVRA